MVVCLHVVALQPWFKIADQKLARGLVAEEVRTHFQSTAKVPSSIVPDPQINGAHVWGSLLALTLPTK